MDCINRYFLNYMQIMKLLLASYTTSTSFLENVRGNIKMSLYKLTFKIKLNLNEIDSQEKSNL